MQALTVIGGIFAFGAVVNGILGVLSAFRRYDALQAEELSKTLPHAKVHQQPV